MNTILVFFVRLILGLVFGILLTRIFKPELETVYGAGIGLLLVFLAYVMAMFRKPKS